MTTMVWTYLAYLAVSISLTIWVAKTLQTNGLTFLVDAFHGHEKLAGSANHLLGVGFYLVNIGVVSLALQFGGKADSVQQAIEYLSLKVGLVLVLLGVMPTQLVLNPILPSVQKILSVGVPAEVEGSSQKVSEPLIAKSSVKVEGAKTALAN